MDLRGVIGRGLGLVQTAVWLILVAPYCAASELPALAISSKRPLRLTGEAEQYPVTELLGRISAFQSRLRFTRFLLIVTRTLVICGIFLLAARLTQLATHQSHSVVVTLAVFVVAGWGLHLALHHSISAFEVARLIDRRLGLKAQIATAVEFTLTDRLDRPLVRTQIRQATQRLRDLDPDVAFPLVWPGRDARVLATVVAAYAVASLVGASGVSLPRSVQPIDAEVTRRASLEAQAPSPFVQLDAAGLPFSAAPPLAGAQVPNSPVAKQLNALQQQLQSQAITPEQYQQDLKQVQQQIAQQAQQSLSAQDALNALASSLKDSSATQSISDNLNQGNYDQASQQLSALGSQLPQMSTQARQQIAQRLGEAAQQTQNLNADISRSSQRAADALRQGDSAAAAQALGDLAKAVKGAGQQASGQPQLGQAMENLQQQMGNPTSASDQNAAQTSADGSSNSADSTTSSAENASASTGQSSNNASSSDKPSNGGASSNGDSSASARGQSRTSSASQLDGQPSANSGGVGSSPGASPLGGAPQSLDAHGVKVVIVGQPSGPGTSSTKPGDRSDPLTAPDGSTLGSAGASAGVPSNVPINVHQESNQVPPGMKPVVREYFTNAGN